ncbi:hypothetical protein BDY21DRAFT_291625 [Lineolata rhizophorae]|uniref:BTB domain-containing protein n=1 Tax=Lineolata rhizophorae TaxID=578093 RepID=A0A6A6NRC4_9PEZI|nr:hypothetical protein BDY21DRAFT_291625 [Lineolata rhizophorae]
MSRQTPNTSRTNTMDSSISAPSPSQLQSDQFKGGSGAYLSSVNSSQSSLPQHGATSEQRDAASATTRTPGSAVPSSAHSPAVQQTAGLGTPNSTAGLSGLVCNVHRTTGKEPRSLVGATTTVLGDRLYVFGGKRLSRTRPLLTSDLYELDLIRRHWTKIDAKGDIPPRRYFHSVCALGDTKLVCYGGMSPAMLPNGQPTAAAQASPGVSEPQPEVVVMSDIHIFDVPTRTWMRVQTPEAPQGRYAHCAAILPSSAVFSSSNATLSAIQHNPAAATNPNQGSIGVALDGTGGAEMVVVGGQDSANHYIEQISVFNLRSLKWTATNTLGRSCGAYRSVVAPLNSIPASRIGTGVRGADSDAEDQLNDKAQHAGSAMLIYSNYNFLDVKLELQIRNLDGTLTEKPMHGSYTPPGLRFPNGGVISNHFVVSGTFLTSSKQEYALWALDLRTLKWARIEAGANIFSQGSWNRGVLWNRRNTFVVLGNRRRNLVEDYNHRRINFANVCMVELEAFGLYDNPRRAAPASSYTSVSAPLQLRQLDPTAGGRRLLRAADELGRMVLAMQELADMEILAVNGERVPVNSRILARRWGPYFNKVFRENAALQEGGDAATLRPPGLGSGSGGSATVRGERDTSRNSAVTITPSVKTGYSNSTALTDGPATLQPSAAGASAGVAPHHHPQPGAHASQAAAATTAFDPPDTRAPNPSQRPRTLYLPHTAPTIQALVHYLYTSSLPAPDSPLSTPQILCSLLQLARPYRVDGLLEAVIARLHRVLDGRNTAAIFNAAAMAAGGGDAVAFATGAGPAAPGTAAAAAAAAAAVGGVQPPLATSVAGPEAAGLLGRGAAGLRINTAVGAAGGARAANGTPGPGPASAADPSTDTDTDDEAQSSEREVWAGELSAVVGLQKRGLRGLMEGRRIREMGRGGGAGGGEAEGSGGGGGRVGLGIA